MTPLVETVRAHETRVTIAASVEEVWKALTDPEALVRWFAPRMIVKPGPGGEITADWGPGLEWKTLIEVWEQHRHLRLAETRDRVLSAAPGEERLEPRRLVEDFYLEANGAETVLRLVHSGFGSSAAWDQEYEGTRDGWQSCFLRLKIGLERHPGKPVRNFIMTRLCPGGSQAAVLAALEAEVPRPFETALRTESHLSAILGGDAILTFSVQRVATGAMAYVEALLFGYPESRAAEFESAWRTRLESWS